MESIEIEWACVGVTSVELFYQLLCVVVLKYCTLYLKFNFLTFYYNVKKKKTYSITAEP